MEQVNEERADEGGVMAKDIKVSVAYGELWIEINAEGVSYAPDAVDDMVQQATKAFSSAIAELRGHGIVRSFDDDEEEIEIEFEEDEEEEEPEED
jgi:hypothetical protein